MQIRVVIVVLLSACFLNVQARDYNILEFGAKPGGKTMNTSAIQAAIDQAHADGGGRVLIPRGTFLSGSIILKSNVELHLEKKAMLLGSAKLADYGRINMWKALILADSAENIAVTGKGVIDGQGAKLGLHVDDLFYAGEIDSAKYEFKERRVKAYIRPQLIEFMSCRNVTVRDVTLQNGASWIQSYRRCENLVIDRVTVDSDTYWNNDGIDVMDCRNVRITDCDINASDDGICLKSIAPYFGVEGLCDSIYIANCRVRSSASAVKFGTWSYGGFRNVVVKDIKVYDTFRSAITLQVVDGGTLEEVLVDGIKAVNTGNAIFIRLGDREKKQPPGRLRNVVIRNVKVQVPYDAPDKNYEIRGPALPFFHNVFPASIVGMPKQAVQDVKLENIDITYPGRGNPAYANQPLSRLDHVPERIADYPEFSMFGELPAWGFYLRHVEGLTLNNVRVRIRKGDYRPAFVFDDVWSLSMQGVEILGDEKDKNGIVRHGGD